MYAVPGLKSNENNWLYFWTVLVPRFGNTAFFLGKIMDNNKLLPCPFCGAEAIVLVQNESFQIVGCSDRKNLLCPSPIMSVFPDKEGKYTYKWWNLRV